MVTGSTMTGHEADAAQYNFHLLVKPVPQMTGDELGLYRKHPVKGEQSLMALEELRGAATIMRAHHERFDGQGYPDGLSGLGIPMGARILSVANDYDGLQIGSLSVRRYTQEDAKKLIAEGRGKRYDPQVVEAFLDIVGKLEVKDTGEIELGAADLKPGMILSRDLMTRDGVLLLAADYILDANLIRQIRDHVRSGAVMTVACVEAPLEPAPCRKGLRGRGLRSSPRLGLLSQEGSVSG